MKLIHKQTFEIVPFWRFTVPISSKIIKVDLQNGTPTFWYTFDAKDRQDLEDRCLNIVGTGQYFNDENQDYLETIQTGKFVWHIFEDKRACRV